MRRPRPPPSLVLQLIDSLPSNQQEVVRLKFQTGLSDREISGITPLSVSNVGFLIRTAIKSLCREMNAHQGLEGGVTRHMNFPDTFFVVQSQFGALKGHISQPGATP